jgi:hypothetical protein
MITSDAEAVVTDAPEGVVVAAWLLNTDVWSRGDAVSTPENSQMTAPPLVAVGLGVIVTLVAPAVLFFAYQMSTMSSEVMTAIALPASVYTLPALSLILLTVGVAPQLEDHATTIK